MQLETLTQAQYERYIDALQALADERNVARFNRAILDAARTAGFARGLPEDLLSLAPREIKALSAQVVAHVNAALAPVAGE